MIDETMTDSKNNDNGKWILLDEIPIDRLVLGRLDPKTGKIIAELVLGRLDPKTGKIIAEIVYRYEAPSLLPDPRKNASNGAC